MADTVEHAAQTPDVEQPYAALGVKDDEYAQIREILGRRPTSAELAMYSVMWSEHCSYKSSKVHLRKFGELSQETPRGPLLAGIGDNAGVVDIGQGYAVTFKAESHNHPSFVEPYQGAATGVGGIVRDILAMGARPIGVMDSLRFGPLDEADTRRVLSGVVAASLTPQATVKRAENENAKRRAFDFMISSQKVQGHVARIASYQLMLIPSQFDLRRFQKSFNDLDDL